MPAVNLDQQLLATLQGRINNDPDIQRLLTQNAQRIKETHDKGGDARKFQNALSAQITQIAKQKGYLPPGKVFINPNDGKIEGKGGWAGLPTAAKIAIIAGAAATGVGAASALGAFGGAAAAGGGAGAAGGGAAAAVPTIGATAGLPAGLFGGGAATSGLLASTPLLSAAPMVGSAAATGGSLAAGAGTAATSGAGLGGKLMSSMLKPDTLSTIGRGIGSIAGTEAANRGTQLDAMMEADKMKLAAGRDRRDEESDLWSKLQAVDYMKSGGAPKTGPGVSASGRPFTSYDFGPAPISQANKDMASTLEPQLLEKLNKPPTLSDYNSKMQPGKVEKTLNWLGPIVSGWGAVSKGFK